MENENAIQETEKLAQLAQEINEEHQAFQKVCRSTYEHAVNIGQKLLLAKAMVGHGNYYKWVEQNCNFTVRTASTYTYLVQKFSFIQEYTKTEVSSEMTISGFMEAVNIKMRETYKEDRKKQKAKSVTERHWHTLNSEEKKIRWQIEMEDKLVRTYLAHIKAFRVEIHQAVEVVKAGRFSPEGMRFTMRKHEELRQELAQLEEMFRLELEKENGK